MRVRAFSFFSLLLLLAAAIVAQTESLMNQFVWAENREASKQQILTAYGNVPLSFEANQGQTDPQVNFLSRGRGYTLFLTSTEAVMALQKAVVSPIQRTMDAIPTATGSEAAESTPPTVLRMKLLGANRHAQGAGLNELPGKSNYFIGNDSHKWRTNVPNYAKVKYEDVYSGIDLVYYGTNQRQLEYDFIIAPGADPKAIRLNFEGTHRLEVDAQGDLLLYLPDGEVGFHKPYVYQEVSGARREIAASYVLKAKNEVAFEVATYNASRPLIIDPVLSYSTYLGGSASDGAIGLAVDASGNAYVTGWSSSPDFPTTIGVFEPSFQGGSASGQTVGDAFVAKLGADGTLIYLTFLGGSADDGGLAIAVDAKGNVYVTGFALSADFPTVRSFDDTFNGGRGDAFVAKLDSTGASLDYATYLGGSGVTSPVGDFGRSIAVDAKGNVYVTGGTDSPDFPTTFGSFDDTFNGGGEDAFVAKLNPGKRGERSLLYSTYLGGSGLVGPVELGHGIDVDAAGNAYVIGWTQSPDFPTTAGVVAFIYNGGIEDAFVVKLDPSGNGFTDLVYSTFVGGSGLDIGADIAVDASGNAYVVGATNSANFPTTPGAFDEIGSASLGADLNIFAGADGYVGKLKPDGSAFAYATYLGGNSLEIPLGVVVDSKGQAYVIGWTISGNFPTTAGAIDRSFNGADSVFGDVFVSRLDPSGSELNFSTFLGGSGGEEGLMIAVDASGNIYLVGNTNSPNFPTTAGAFDETYGGGSSDAFVTKITHDD